MTKQEDIIEKLAKKEGINMANIQKDSKSEIVNIKADRSHNIIIDKKFAWSKVITLIVLLGFILISIALFILKLNIMALSKESNLTQTLTDLNTLTDWWGKIAFITVLSYMLKSMRENEVKLRNTYKEDYDNAKLNNLTGDIKL